MNQASGAPKDGDKLTSLRAELGQLDERLLDTIRARIECCMRIAEYKRDHDVPMMQPQRFAAAQDRAAAFARVHGVTPDFLRAFYELMISETCRVEDEIISGAGPA